MSDLLDALSGFFRAGMIFIRYDKVRWYHVNEIVYENLLLKKKNYIFYEDIET